MRRDTTSSKDVDTSLRIGGRAVPVRLASMALAVALAVATPGAGAQSTTADASALSTLPIAVSVAAPVAILSTAFQHIGILSLEFHVDKLSRPLL